ncbi:MAG: hypothetical protein AAGJ37_11585 [Pseudomonadota bacterium]
MKKVWILFLASLFATVLLTSPLAYLISYILSEQHNGHAISSLIAQYQQMKRNPFFTSLLSVFPFILLAVLVVIAQKRKTSAEKCYVVMVCGALAIFVIMFWINLVYWPNFLPDVPYPGFPHGLELVIAPLFFAPVGMLIGVLCGWFIVKGK